VKAPETVRVGFVRRAVGLGGELEVEPLGENPGRFVPGSLLRLAGRQVEVEQAQPGGPVVRLKLVGVGDRDAADRLRGQYLEVSGSDVPSLPEGAYYQWQLVGLGVVDPSGQPLGRLEEVLEYPANDVYRVVNGGAEILVPAVREVVREVDLDGGRMVVLMPAEDEVR